MPTRIILVLAVLLPALFAFACSDNTSSAANAAPPAIEIPVGPVPGPGKAMQLPTNPYENNPVALAEGRRLFNWYNCSGCHAAMRAAAWDRAFGTNRFSSTAAILHTSSPRFLKAARKACRLGARKFPRIRSGNWWHTSSPCARRRNPILQRFLLNRKREQRSRYFHEPFQ